MYLEPPGWRYKKCTMKRQVPKEVLWLLVLHLLVLIQKKAPPLLPLGPKMGIEATSLSRTLKKMEQQGLIDRRPNPEDGRGVLIHLTAFGKEMREFSKGCCT